MNKLQIKIFILASLISTLGSALTNIALSYRFLLDDINFGTSYGILMFAASISSIIISPIIGFYIDRTYNYKFLLIFSEIIMGIIIVLFSITYNIFFASCLIIIQTILSILISSIIFKLLPSVLNKKELFKINISLENINTYGFIFGPLIAPLVILIVHSDTSLFIIDSITFFCSATLNFIVINKLIIPQHDTQTESKNINLLNLIFKDFNGLKEIENFKKVSLALCTYFISFSAMAYSLALIANNIVHQDKILYSIPIISMFIGRIIGLKFISRLNLIQNNISILFIISLIGSAIIMIPLGLIKSIILLSILEFILGIFIAITKVSERTYLQYKIPNQFLGKIGSLRQAIQLSVKLISVPLVILLSQYINLFAVSLVLGLLYALSAFIFFRRQR